MGTAYQSSCGRSLERAQRALQVRERMHSVQHTCGWSHSRGGSGHLLRVHSTQNSAATPHSAPKERCRTLLRPK